MTTPTPTRYRLMEVELHDRTFHGNLDLGDIGHALVSPGFRASRSASIRCESDRADLVSATDRLTPSAAVRSSTQTIARSVLVDAVIRRTVLSRIPRRTHHMALQ